MANKQPVTLPGQETEIDLITNAMNGKGVSMNALADQTGIPYPTIRRSLKAGRSLTLEELRKIAAALDTTPSALLPEARHGAKAAA